MTDKKISELTQITGADVDDDNDEIAIVDASASETKSITRTELFKGVTGLTTNGIVEIAEGSVVLNGSTISAVQVTVADDAVAELTFTNRRFGMLNVVEGSDNTPFPATTGRFFGYVDFGNSPDSATISIGGGTEIDDTNTLTGTTGTDGKITIGTAGTSGTLYIENRSGNTQTFSVTLL